MPDLQLPDSLDEYPTSGVASFVSRFAAARGIAYRRTKLDEWCDAITRASGDDVASDATCDLLVALVRSQSLTARQMSRLLTNHLRERKSLLA